jgi:hypothetical protein
MLPTANCPADMMATMMTCVPEMPQMVLSDGSRSPRSSVAHMTSISSPGSAVQTANVTSRSAETR